MTHVSLNSVPCLFRLHVKYVSDLFYDKNKTIQEYLINLLNIQIGCFCFCFGYMHDTNQYKSDHDLGHADI